MRRVEIVSLLSEGRVSWDAAFALQKEAAARVKAGGHETLFLLEHEDVVTVGRNAGLGELLVSEDFLAQKASRSASPTAAASSRSTGPASSSRTPFSTSPADRRDVRRYVRDLEEVTHPYRARLRT